MLTSIKSPQKPRVAIVVSPEGIEGVYVMAGNTADKAEVIRIVNSIDALAVLVKKAVADASWLDQS